jgi:hypothetical protein
MEVEEVRSRGSQNPEPGVRHTYGADSTLTLSFFPQATSLKSTGGAFLPQQRLYF